MPAAGHVLARVGSAGEPVRQTLLEAKDILVNLQGSGAGAELKGGFERAWQEIEKAFTAARQRAKEAAERKDGGEGGGETP